MIARLLIVGIALIYIFQAEAQSSVENTGCSAQSANISLSKNQDSLSLGLEHFVVEAGRTLGRRLERKSCQISIPVKVPEGYEVSVKTIDYRAYAMVPAGGLARIEVETFLGTERGLQAEKILSNTFDDGFRQVLNPGDESLKWSACGKSFDLKVKTSMMVQSNNRMDAAASEINSGEPSNKMNLQLQWRKCKT